jgi:hypothetical protein
MLLPADGLARTPVSTRLEEYMEENGAHLNLMLEKGSTHNTECQQLIRDIQKQRQHEDKVDACEPGYRWEG